jgi:hypothetical protein
VSVVATSEPQTQLKPGSEIHVIACVRAGPGMGTAGPVISSHVGPAADGSVLGVRWASRPDIGFPDNGYRLAIVAPDELDDDGKPRRAEVGTYFLPASDSWASFEADAQSRKPAGGPWFPSIDEESLGFLVPLVRLADPRTPLNEQRGLTVKAADFFGHPHGGDAELAWRFWKLAQPPPLDDLMKDQLSALALIGFYRRHTTNFLLVLALRFEYAALFGLGADVPRAGTTAVVAEVTGSWQAYLGVATSDRARTNSACSLAPPAWLKADRAPGTVAHPAFAAWPSWEPPADLAPLDAQGNPLPAAASIPRAPAAFTALTWPYETSRQNVIDYGPVLYRLARHDHGAATAGSLTTPPLAAGATWTEVVAGEAIIRGDEDPQYLDLPGMAWPPLEGHYHYALWAFDLLGSPSRGPAMASVRHHDDLAPARPRASATDGPLATVAAGASSVSIPLRIDWDAAEDFAGPDAAEFRVAAQWTPQQAIPVHVDSSAGVDSLHADVTVSTLSGKADQYAGRWLTFAATEYPIVSHTVGTPAKLRVVKVAGGVPAAGADGVIFSAGSPTTPTRVARSARRPAVAATPSKIDSLEPLDLELTVSAQESLPSDAAVRIYLHLLRASFDAQNLGGGKWRVAAPAEGTPARAAWEKWSSLADPAAALQDSPAIVFPPHSLTVSAPVPSGWLAGIVTLLVTAADSASYVDSPALPVADPALAAPTGNESARGEVVVSVRSLSPPGTPTVAAFDPTKRIWAHSAASYAEASTYDVKWSSAPGPLRYEVWRALEGALSGAQPSTTDAQLRALAGAQADAFELRSDRVFSTSFLDELPGRAPTRALYRVRAVNAGGVVGAPSDLIGPVHVPDVRQPPVPNLLRVAAAAATYPDRAIAVDWTQAGPVDGVRFDVLFREAGSTPSFAKAGSLPAGTAPGTAGRYRFLHLERTPGKEYEYRVVAVREALDPIDPAAATKRDVAGPPSAARSGSAISRAPLDPPVSLAAKLTGAADVELTWQNRDSYESIEIWRRADSDFLHRRVGVAVGGAQSFKDSGVAAGTWHYQLRARGIRREARSATEAQVVVT